MWAIHPACDVAFTMRLAGGGTTVRLDRPGACLIVPRGAWHTARPLVPTALLFLTPGEGTENAPAPPDD